MATQKKKQKKESAEKRATDDNKKDKKGDKTLIISIVIIIALFGSLIFLIMSLNKDKPVVSENVTEVKTYGGFVFTKDGNVWVTRMSIKDTFKGWEREYEIFFHYTPDEVEDIETMRNARNETVSPNLFLDARKIYITMDPKYPSEVILGAVEIAKILGKVYEREVKSAIIRPDNRTDAPVITCNDIGPGVRVIQLELTNQTRIYSNRGCIVVQGTNTTELLKASERLAYEMLKVL